MLSPNIIIAYDGEHANIPSGWVRETSLDGRFPKGSSSGVGDTGGSATHTHTSSNSHTHNISNHTHSYTTGVFNANGVITGQGSGNWNSHSHTGTSGNLNATYTSPSANPSWSAASHTPPNYRFIPIKSVGHNLLPRWGCILSTIFIGGLTEHTDSSGKIVAFASDGQDAGDGGGSTSHSHSFSHNHGNISHNHSSAMSNTGSGVQSASHSGGESGRADTSHRHNVSFGSANAPTNNHTSTYEYSNIEPVSKGCRIYKNNSESSVLPPINMIAMTTESEVPIGWKLCDGTNGTHDLDSFYIKNTTVGSVSGSNTHSHSQSHTHTYNNHTHSYSAATNTESARPGMDSDPNRKWTFAHSHSGTTNSGGGGTTSSGTVVADSSNNEPEYVEVKFIQLEFLTGGGGAIIPNFI